MFQSSLSIGIKLEEDFMRQRGKKYKEELNGVIRKLLVNYILEEVNN